MLVVLIYNFDLLGLTNDGLSLIQRYVDTVGDVQTASLIVLHSLPNKACADLKAQAWVHCYRNLLDTWKLWKPRYLYCFLHTIFVLFNSSLISCVKKHKTSILPILYLYRIWVVCFYPSFFKKTVGIKQLLKAKSSLVKSH